MKLVTIIAITSICGGCYRAQVVDDDKSQSSAPARDSSRVVVTTHEMLNAALWDQSSAEYGACTSQAYGLALTAFRLGLKDPKWTAALEQEDLAGYEKLPPAVMLDLDETVFVNASYEARQVTEYGQYSPKTFAKWCNEAKCKAVPGAKRFLDEVAAAKVAIIYFSGREGKLREGSVKNLRNLEYPFREKVDELHLSDEGSTEARRTAKCMTHRIVMILGDNLDDFCSGSKATPVERRRVAERNAEKFGSKWIILPNPMYGHWEASFYNFDYGLPREQQLEEKIKALVTE